MPKLPQISGNKLAKAFFKDGWYEVHSRGSHLKIRKNLIPAGKKTIIIPLHKIIKKGTFAGILKDSGMSLEKIISLL